MKTFNQLKKNTKQPIENWSHEIKLAILSDSSSQLFCKALEGYSYEVGVKTDLFEAEYNQISLQIFDDTSDFNQHNFDYIVVQENCFNLEQAYHTTSVEDRLFFAENKLKDVKQQFEKIKQNHTTKGLLYFNFIEEDHSIYGNFANKCESSFLYQIRKLNYLLMEYATQESNFQIIDYKLLHQRFGDEFSISEASRVNNSMNHSIDIMPYMAKSCFDLIAAQLGGINKCLILDLDNTTWGGIIGDDGIENIQVGSLGIGKAFSNLQRWAKELKNRGIILAICSKNFESVAKKVFEDHPEMVLRLEDISVFVANWDNKADNIRYIQKILNIGFDSMVFVDDNKFERELVKKSIPELTVPDIPEDPSEYVNYLKKLNLFEATSFVQNDTNRTKQYQVESERRKEEQSFSNQDDFLKDLQMKADFSAFNSFNTPRIAQLIQRSNQFNLRTIRYTEKELTDLSNSENHYCFSVSLKDRFGDTGLISVIILEKKENHLFIDTWVMSCRVLKRGVEQAIINFMMELVEKSGKQRLVGERIPTKKNIFVEDLFKDQGFDCKDGQLWEYELTKFETKDCFIEPINSTFF